MKTMTTVQYMKPLAIAFFFLLLAACSKDDGPTDSIAPPIRDASASIFGKWEVLSGGFRIENTKYLYINEDNTINFLAEDPLGFRDNYQTNSTVTENQLTLSGGGQGSITIYNYTLNENDLTIQLPYEAPNVLLKRISTGPGVNTWIKTLTILEQGIAPWERAVDIAFDGTYLLGFDNESNDILKLSPTDFSVVDRIPSSHSAYAVEIEKSDSEFKQLFQSDNGGTQFYSYIYRSNDLYYDSERLGSWINGLASVAPGYLWVSSSNEKELYHYKSNGALSPGEVLETIALSFQPYGLDYQDGYLYITASNRVFKCQTGPDFKVLETYKISGHSVSGIAFDGTDFWVSTNAWADDSQKLMKVAFPL